MRRLFEVVVLHFLPLLWQGALGRSDAEREKDKEILENGTCVTITTDNWDQHMTLSRDQHMLVIFHVDWCSACRRTFPIFLDAAVEAQSQRINARFGHIDCGEEKQLCNRYDVKGYPSIKLFAEGKSVDEPRDAKCPRTVQGFISYLRRMVRAPVQHILSDMTESNRLEHHLKDEPLSVFVGVIPDQSDNPVGLQAAADALRDQHSFYAIPDLSSAFGPESPLVVEAKGATLVSFSMSSQQWAASNESARPAMAVYNYSLGHNQTVVAWAEKHRFPGIWRLNDGIFSEFVRQGRKVVIVVVNPEMDNTKVEDALRQTARALHDEFCFGVLNGLDWAQPLTDFNIYVHELPRVFVMENGYSEWIEDIEQLRVAELESDLRNLLDGAPLLRQGYSPVKRLRFHVRELKRKLLKIWAYAQRGRREASIVAAALFTSTLGAVAIMLCGYLIYKELFYGGDADHSKFD